MPDTFDARPPSWGTEQFREAELRYEERMLDARNATQELLESAVEDSINEIRSHAPDVRWPWDNTSREVPASYGITESEDDIGPVEDVPYPQTIFVGTGPGEIPLVIRNKDGDKLVEVWQNGEVKATSIPDLEEALRLVTENYGYWEIPEDRVWEPQLD